MIHVRMQVDHLLVELVDIGGHALGLLPAESRQLLDHPGVHHRLLGLHHLLEKVRGNVDTTETGNSESLRKGADS